MIKKSWTYLGTELKKFREENMKVSQVEFAKIFDISKSLVCKVEAGERRFNEDLMLEMFSKYSFTRFEQLKLLILSELPFHLDNTEEECYIVIKLIVDLKNKGLYSVAKELISKSLQTFDDSVDFYVLLSTVNLMESKFKKAEETIILALDLYNSGIKSVTTLCDLYHNYGNIFFKISYNYEFKKIEIVSNLVKQGLSKEEILKNKEYIDISKEIMDIYLKAEEKFLRAYEIDPNNILIVSQLSRLYFNIANLNLDSEKYIDKAYKFLTQFNEFEKVKVSDKLELSILLCIILALKNMENFALILANNVLGFKPDNALTYYAKALIYSYMGSNGDKETLNKSIYNISKMLEISNNDSSLKLEILADLNFENVRQNHLTSDEFKKLLF